MAPVLCGRDEGGARRVVGDGARRRAEERAAQPARTAGTEGHEVGAVLGDGVEFVVNPDESSVSSQQLPIREAALGLILGLVIAGTVAYLRADSDAAKQRRA